VIVRKAFGGAFITMNSKDLGADASFCWPEAEIGIMSAEAAVEIIHRKRVRDSLSGDAYGRLARRYAEESLSVDVALRSGAIDAVIHPVETRERVIHALRLGGAAAPALEEAFTYEHLAAASLSSAGAPPQMPRRITAPASGYRLTTAPEGAPP
jgi:acetyl-CoA carboxylase carboxyltransferase component